MFLEESVILYGEGDWGNGTSSLLEPVFMWKEELVDLTSRSPKPQHWLRPLYAMSLAIGDTEELTNKYKQWTDAIISVGFSTFHTFTSSQE